MTPAGPGVVRRANAAHEAAREAGREAGRDGVHEGGAEAERDADRAAARDAAREAQPREGAGGGTSEALALGEQFARRLSGPDALQLIIEVAHDMRSPLGSILFLAERLRSMQSGPLTSVQERQIGLVYSAAFGLSALAGDVIELARGGEGLVHQRPIPFSVTDVMRSVASIVQPIAEEKGLTVRLATPPADSRLGQPVALSRVLLNLTTNALKFTTDGSVEVSATQRSRTRLEFAVQDTGRGIPSEVMATLFEPFRRRQDTDRHVFSSAGLGLAICRQLVGAMGGELGVTTSDAGTRFAFEIDLPLATKL